MNVKYVPSMHLFSLMAPQQPKKEMMTTKTLTAMRMMADVEKTVIEKLFFVIFEILCTMAYNEKIKSNQAFNINNC